MNFRKIFFHGLVLALVATFPASPANAEVEKDVGVEGVDSFFEQEEVFDHLESMNRVFFVVNDKLYFWVLKPVSKVYGAVLPQDVRLGLGNFFVNVAAPVRVVNNLLQGKVGDAGTDLQRFLINSTLGFAGFGDPAKESFGIQAKPEDLGQTLGVWGVGEGAYLFLPLLGPLTVRDAFGFVGDRALHPATYILTEFPEEAAYSGTDKVNRISLHPGLYEEMKRNSLDPYISIRQAFLEYRRNKVLDRDVRNNAFREEQ